MDKAKIEFINQYIARCDAVENQVQAENLQREIISVFSDDIPGISKSLHRASFDFNQPATIDYLSNISILKKKLEYYKLSAERTNEIIQETKEAPAIVVNQYNQNSNTQNVTVSVQTNLEIALQQIDALPNQALSDDEKDLLRGKLTRIEEAPDKPSKWEKAKNVLKWVIDKGIEVGTAVLPYIAEVLKK